ncbi:MAG: ABC transporter substrate-binding protein [Acidimicrobiales bacterium]
MAASRDDEGRSDRSGRTVDRRRFLAGGGGLAGAVLLGACSTSSPKSGGVPTTKAPVFPLGAAANAKSKPVAITFWHSMQSANLTALQNMTRAFNASQPDVSVSLVNQASYTDTLTLYTAALSGGALPDVVQMESSDLQLMIDSQSIVSAQAAIDADHYDLSDFLASTVDFFKVGGVIWAVPFNISSQVLYFDANAFTKAGLDPSTPPTTLVDLQSAAQKIVSSETQKYGMSLKLSPSTFEEWLAMASQPLLNNGNGRTSRATSVVFDDAEGQTIASYYHQMYSTKLAQPTSATTYDNLFAIANRIAPMTLETSAALGTVVGLLGGYPDVKLGVGPMPGPSATGGVFVGGAGLYMVSKSSDERQDAAWQYIKYLVEPAQQATWAAASGYIPVRKSAISEEALQSRWAQIPQFKVAYDQILASPQSAATAGPVCGAQAQVDNAVQDGLTSISNGTGALAALAQAASTADQAISSYDSRL